MWIANGHTARLPLLRQPESLPPIDAADFTFFLRDIGNAGSIRRPGGRDVVVTIVGDTGPVAARNVAHINFARKRSVPEV